MRRVELPALDAKDVRSLTALEIGALRDKCRGEWTSAFVELAMATGCRRGELLALEWSDVDWTTLALSVSKSIEQTAAGLRVKRPKNGKSRRCTLPRSTIEALRVHRARYAPGRLMFPGTGGLLRKPDVVSHAILSRMRRAKIPHASLHSLRHTHATHLLSRGVPLTAVAARLGHGDPNVTARVYAHALPLDDHRSADAWEAVLKENDKASGQATIAA